ADIVSTISDIRDNAIIVSMILLAGAAAMLISHAYQAQMPGYAEDLGHGTAGLLYGLLLAADAAGALTAGIVLAGAGLPAAPAQHRVRAGHDLVRPARRLCADHELPARGNPAVFRRVPRAVLQLDGAGPGAAQRANRHPRAGARPLQHGGSGPARVQRRHDR